MRVITLLLICFTFFSPVLEAQNGFKKAVFTHLVTKKERTLQKGNKVSVYLQEADGSVKLYQGKLMNMTSHEITLQSGKQVHRLELAKVTSLEYRKPRAPWAKALMIIGSIAGAVGAVLLLSNLLLFIFSLGTYTITSGGSILLVLLLGLAVNAVGKYGSSVENVVMDYPMQNWDLMLFLQA